MFCYHSTTIQCVIFTYLYFALGTNAFSSPAQNHAQLPHLATTRTAMNMKIKMDTTNNIPLADLSSSSSRLRRREVLATFSSLFLSIATKREPANATGSTGSIKTSQFATKGSKAQQTTNDPKEAYQNLKEAKQELLMALDLMKKARKDPDLVDTLKDFLVEGDSMKNMNNFEGNALALLKSKALSPETRREIGTIRTYGVGKLFHHS